MEKDARFIQFLQGGTEGVDYSGRQLPDKSYSIGDKDDLLVGQYQTPSCRIKGGEKLVFGKDVRPAQCIKQRALPGIGVADDRDYRDADFLSPLAVERPLLTYFFLASEFPNFLTSIFSWVSIF